MSADWPARWVRSTLGYEPRDVGLFAAALTHRSASGENNERLEFLGDRVLGLIVADMLLKLFPEEKEGDIAPRFNALVDARTCSDIGLELELNEFMRADAALKSGARKGGGNYLADAVEALVAAIYLDGGIQAAQAFVLDRWEPRARRIVEKPANPKGELQEWVARSSEARPVYSIDNREGPDHQPIFTVSVNVPGFTTATGSGTSRRAAEEAAASAFLVREGVWAAEKAAE